MSERLSRWSDDPILDREGNPRVFKPSRRDREIVFPILARYAALPVHYIHALMGTEAGNLDYLADHLPRLVRRPNSYLQRHRAQRRSGDSNYRYQVYSLSDTRLTNFWHDLMASMVMAQIEIGARRQDLDLADFSRILTKAPEETRRLHRPGTLSLTYMTAQGHAQKANITADWTPFAIGKNSKFRFYFGIEADCHTESLNASRMDHSSIVRKFREYLAVNEQRLAQRIFGLPGPFYFLFVTDLPARVDGMIKLLLEVTKGKGSPYFLFRYFPSYDDYEKPPLPMGALITEPYKRAGHPDFFMNEL